MNSIRTNYKCNSEEFAAFIQNIKKDKSFVFRLHNPADSSISQDRYTFSKDNCRISIVYETKAKTLIITAPPNIMDSVALLVCGEKMLLADKEKKTEGSKRQSIVLKDRKEVERRKKAMLPEKQNNGKVKSDEKVKNSEKIKNGEKKGIIEKIALEEIPEKNNSLANTSKTKKRSNNKKSDKQESALNPNPNEKTFTIKNLGEERFTELIKKIRKNKTMRYKTDKDGSYTISLDSEKAKLAFRDGNVTLIGLKGRLFGELQLMMSQACDYKTAIDSHIKLVGEAKRVGDIEKQLRRKIPDAYGFLSEQSKIDLAIGLIDINNSDVVLSDYSMLLIPCFRGLERFIFDLQRAKGIEVKMIGQAYEKDDGNYILKYGYRRRIPSVIYCEVMTSLYKEYAAQRNFYTHSDGGFDNLSRIITDKQQVQTIFNNILQTINYNCKKLKEIEFQI